MTASFARRALGVAVIIAGHLAAGASADDTAARAQSGVQAPAGAITGDAAGGAAPPARRSAQAPDDAARTLGLFLAAGGPDAVEAREIRDGAQLAVDECAGDVAACSLKAAAGGGQWTAGAGGLVALVYSDGISAILGPADGRSAHLAEQVAARAKGRFVLLTPWVSDPTLTRIRVPWFFRLVPDDLQQAAALLEAMRGMRSVAVLVAQYSYDMRTACEAFEKVASRAGAPVLTRIAVAEPAETEALVGAVVASHAEALLLLVPPQVAQPVVRRLRDAGSTPAFFGPLRLASRSFLDGAGDAAEGMVLAAPAELPAAVAEDFRARYRSAYHGEPSVAAAYGYDGAALLLQALRSGGAAAQESLREAVAKARRGGVTGSIAFDEFGNRAGPAPLARVHEGRLRPVAASNADPAQVGVQLEFSSHPGRDSVSR